MARAGLGWTLLDLAERSGINPNTISRFEVGRDILSGKLHRLEDTLRSAGVVFHDDDTKIGVSVPLAAQDMPRSKISPKRTTRLRSRMKNATTGA
jgi:transcriptional regulator with XRE-family HTH domain